MTEEHTPTLLERVGGVSGLVYSGIPTFAYVIVNAVAGLNAAVLVSIGIGFALGALRLVRREPIQPAVSGLLGVVVAALIAFYSGSAQDYFLPGIWLSLIMAVAFSMSLVVRRPVVGLLWNLMRSAGPDPAWRTDKITLRGFDAATLTFTLIFVARFVVQQGLYDGGRTGWLAFAHIAMGYPLLGAALAVTYWAVRRANHRTASQMAIPNTSVG